MRLRFTGATANVLQRLPRFFILQLPAALYRVRWLTLAVTIAFFAIWTAYALYYIANPEVIASMTTPEQRRQYAEEDFVDYYSDNSRARSRPWSGPTTRSLAALSLATGILFAVFPIYTIVSNAASLGFATAVMNEFSHLDDFFLYLAPHGQLELYMLFLASATGIFIFWSWIAPGPRKRAGRARRGWPGLLHDRDRLRDRARHLGRHRGFRHPAGLALADQDRHRHRRPGRVPALPVGGRPAALSARARPVTSTSSRPGPVSWSPASAPSTTGCCCRSRWSAKKSEIAVPSGSGPRAMYSSKMLRMRSSSSSWCSSVSFRPSRVMWMSSGAIPSISCRKVSSRRFECSSTGVLHERPVAR